MIQLAVEIAVVILIIAVVAVILDIRKLDEEIDDCYRQLARIERELDKIRRKENR